VVKNHIVVFSIMILFIVLGEYQCLEGVCCLHFQGNLMYSEIVLKEIIFIN
jgi:hypothetical protein